MACPTLHGDTPTLWWPNFRERDKKSLSDVYCNSHVSRGSFCWFDERLARLANISRIENSFRSRIEAVHWRQAYYCFHLCDTGVCNAFNAMEDLYCIQCGKLNSYVFAEYQAGVSFHEVLDAEVMWHLCSEMDCNSRHNRFSYRDRRPQQQEASYTSTWPYRTHRGNPISVHCQQDSQQDVLKPLIVLSINLARCFWHNVLNHIFCGDLFLCHLLPLWLFVVEWPMLR